MSNITVDALSELAHLQLDREAEVARLEKELKVAKAKLSDVSEQTLPEAMRALGLGEFTTHEGVTIKIKNLVTASISADRTEAAMAELERLKQGGVIKRLITVAFGKGEEAWAKKFIQDLSRRRRKVNAEVKESVHPSTLKALVNEMLVEGIEFPLELFGVHVLPTSVVTVAKHDKD